MNRHNKIFTLFFLLGLSLSISAQETLYGCIEIDFETIPGETNLYEGLPIGDQYYDEFGLTFRIEGGGIPVLAEVGSPATGFGSAWGNDTPKPFPDQGIGQFFITDDGVLGGLTSPPVILFFETPIDSFAGCVMDMDFDERFIIHALDADDNIILADTINADPVNPQLYDGEASCWGFNLAGCEGQIYAIRFAGERDAGGFFGMGLDRFSFCYSGINIAHSTEQPTCLALNGSLNVFSTTTEEYEFSLDGINFFPSGEFTDLGPDIYEVFVRDTTGCETSVDIEIFAAQDPLFVEVDVENTKCNLDNGSVFFDVVPDIGATFSIDGGNNYFDVNSFDNLAPGDYIIQAIDENFCTGELSFTIEPSLEPEILSVEEFRESCLENDGSLLITGNSGTPPYEYALEGGTFDINPEITDLSDGSYTVVLRDAEGCLVSAEAQVPAYPTILLSDFGTFDPECVTANGQITVNATGGAGVLNYILDDGLPQSSNIFSNLTFGLYSVSIIDEEGCSVEDTLSLAIPRCPIYVPNIISGNGDGVNDFFTISIHPDYNAEILCYWIFDRWGELIYESKNYSAHSFETAFSNRSTFWWNGYFQGEPAETGVYAYLVELRHENGALEKVAGTVTLIR